MFRYLCCCAEQTISPTPCEYKQRLKSEIPTAKVQIIPDLIRKTTQIVAYSCPICFLYYSDILYCDACCNCMCIFCITSIMEKSNSLKEVMCCPFCKSTESLFKDWDEEARIYFDKSAGGPFMPSALRVAADSILNKDKQVAEHKQNDQQKKEAESSELRLNEQREENTNNSRILRTV